MSSGTPVIQARARRRAFSPVSLKFGASSNSRMLSIPGKFFSANAVVTPARSVTWPAPLSKFFNSSWQMVLKVHIWHPNLPFFLLEIVIGWMDSSLLRSLALLTTSWAWRKLSW